EAAGPAGAGREVDELPGDLLGAALARFLLEEVDEVAGGEAGRAALPDVGDLAAGEQVVLGGHRKDLGLVAAGLEHALDDPLDAPVQPTEEDRHRVALRPRERPRGVRAVMVSCGSGD